MKKLLLLASILTLASVAHAARKPCDELKAEIEAKMKAHGVKEVVLDVKAADQAGDAKVLGSCDGGARRIVRVR